MQAIETDFGLFVRWDGVHTATIRMSSNYFNNTCGLCGTFDDDASNDFRIPDGTVVS